MLDSIFGTASAVISTQNVLICMGVALALGLVISFTHRITSRASSNFLISLSILPLLVQVVILLVNGNLGTSLAVAGTFGLIRFRSMQGTSKELISVFWAMATGLALGMGYIVYAVVLTVIVAILMIVVSRVAEKIGKGLERKLKIEIPENLDYEDVYAELLEKYTEKYNLIKVKTTNMGSMYELSYDIELKEGIKEKEFLDEIRVRNGNMLVMLERPRVGEMEL